MDLEKFDKDGNMRLDYCLDSLHEIIGDFDMRKDSAFIYIYIKEDQENKYTSLPEDTYLTMVEIHQCFFCLESDENSK